MTKQPLKVINIKLTDAEYAQLKKQAYDNLQNVSEYIRRLIREDAG